MILRVRSATVAAEAKSVHTQRDDASSGGTAAATNIDSSDENRNDFPEIDCLRSWLPAHVLSNAEDRAARLAIGADRVLIASGVIDEETYLRCLGNALGIKFEPLTDVPRALCPLTDDRLIKCNSDGLLLLTIDDKVLPVLTLRETQARWLARLLRHRPSLATDLRLTTSEQFSHFILHYAGKTLLANAVDSFKERWPELSAGPPRRVGQLIVVTVTVALSLSGMSLITHSSILVILEIIITTFFLSWTWLRLACALMTWREKSAPLLDMADANLPVYSIIAALYDEAKSVDKLLHNFERLDYPPERLDIILAIEAKDHATRAAIEACKTLIPIRVIICPDSPPYTKPKALNVALPFARGDYTVIYDAEDRPEPDQLRRALQAFSAAGDDLICVQARLCIDNTYDSWLTKLFTAEYAGHFDVFLSWLAKMRLPLPLGGSSNHFRTKKLREIGAWDPYNVTEDADLGIRLARFGYRSDVIHSTTYEEAPAHYPAWLRQRTRWLKGWMQTWVVHMRHPRRLMRDLGVAGFIAFQLIVGGSVFAALVHLIFILILTVTIVYDLIIGQIHALPIIALLGTFLGYLPSMFIGWLGLARRNLISITPILLATPLHWVLLSHAAWRALGKFIFDLYEWEKTEHGLAKTSRLTKATARSLLLLERHLETLNSREASLLCEQKDKPHEWPSAGQGSSRGTARATNKVSSARSHALVRFEKLRPWIF